MKNLFIIFMCFYFTSIAFASKEGKEDIPAPEGQGTYAELDGDNDFTGTNLADGWEVII